MISVKQLNKEWENRYMPAKKDHWAEMIKRTEAQIETFQTELIFADPPKTEAEAAVILQSIEDQVA